MKPWTLARALALLLISIPIGSWAKPCGDDVDGHDVPCACGDIVVSSVALSDSDPVVHAACSRDGLIVRAIRSTQRVTIDLRGHTLEGNGHGTGLLVLGGGPGGARIVSSTGRATVAGFKDGLTSHGSNTALIDGLIFANNQRDGLSVEGRGYRIRNTDARDSGRDAFSLMGRGYHLSATRAVNSKRFGYFVHGQSGVIGAPGAGSVSERSGQAGFSLSGPGHHLIDCVATQAGKAGVTLNGDRYEIRGCTVTGNLGDGITGMGQDWTVMQNVVSNNGENGLSVSGPGVLDGGGNRGSGNRGGRRRLSVAQCEINHQPCQP